MLNNKSLEAVAQASWSKEFVRPLYGSYCYAHLPQTVLSAFGLGAENPLPPQCWPEPGREFDKVVTLFIDALGWELWSRLTEEGSLEALRYLNSDGVVSKLTAQFPSTTAAHVTTIHSGLPPAQSGIYEWYFYSHEIGRLVNALLYNWAGQQERNTLVSEGVDPSSFLPEGVLYPNLKTAGIPSYIFQLAEYLDSPYNTVVCRDTIPKPYTDPRKGLGGLTDQALASGRGYHFYYFDGIDSSSHKRGPFAEKTLEIARGFLTDLWEHLLYPLSRQASNTLLMLFADHGQIEIRPEQQHWIEDIYPEIEEHTLPGSDGRPLLPAGSPRDFFLHIQPDRIEEVTKALRDKLAGVAEVHPTSKLLEEGLFGSEQPSQRFLNNVGNLVVLPLAGQSVFWRDWPNGEKRPPNLGMHGGLSPIEMEIPLVMLAL